MAVSFQFIRPIDFDLLRDRQQPDKRNDRADLDRFVVGSIIDLVDTSTCCATGSDPTSATTAPT